MLLGTASEAALLASYAELYNGALDGFPRGASVLRATGCESRDTRLRMWARAYAVAVALTAALASGQDASPVAPALVRPSPVLWPADAGPTGDVELLLTIDTSGRVVDARIELSPGEAFGAAALLAAQGLIFDPFTQDGGAVGVVLRWRYAYEAPLSLVDAGVARIIGRVMTKGTRDATPLARVAFTDGGAHEADGDGRFTLEVPAGPVQVEVTASGHQKRVFTEQVAVGETVRVIYRLERTFLRPYETIVRSEPDRAEVSRITLTDAELHDTAGTGGQPLRVVMLLPGVVTPASGLSYPIVRGSLPAATGYYLDGVRMPQLYHLMAATSVVHPDFIDRIDFFASNAPSRYGRISGGVVAAQVAKARDDRVHVSISSDILQSNAFLDVPIQATGTNITVAGSANYAGWLLGLLSAANLFGGARPVLESYDYQARVEQKVGEGKVRLLAFGSSDVAGIRGPTTYLATTRFHRIDLRGQFLLGPGVLEVASNVGWETMGLTAATPPENGGQFNLDRFTWTGRASYRFEVNEHLQLKAGFDFERQLSDVENTIAAGTGGDLLRQPRVMGVFTGTFAEVAFFWKQWAIVGGARVDTWLLPPDLTLVSVNPRLDVRFKPFETLTLRASAGISHQAPMLLISLPVSDTAALKTGLQEVGQFSLGGVGRLPWGDLELSGDVFYNHVFQARERSLQEFATGLSSLDDRFTGSRWGRAYGLELMLRLPQQGRLFGWLSYTFMRSERLRRFVLYDANQSYSSDTTAMLPFAFDQAHTLNLTVGYQLPKGYKVSASVHFNTGRPESGEFSSRTSRLVENPATGEQRWAVVPLSEVERLPAYARLDLRVSKTITYSRFTAELYLDVLNTLGIPEVFGYDYSYSQETPPVPVKTAFSLPIVLPTLGVKVTY